MKKRKMKKYIPKNTSYCYDLNGKSCKWHRLIKNKRKQENGYCMYLKSGDWEDDRTSLLWDFVKECGLKEDYK